MSTTTTGHAPDCTDPTHPEGTCTTEPETTHGVTIWRSWHPRRGPRIHIHADVALTIPAALAVAQHIHRICH